MRSLLRKGTASKRHVKEMNDPISERPKFSCDSSWYSKTSQGRVSKYYEAGAVPQRIRCRVREQPNLRFNISGLSLACKWFAHHGYNFFAKPFFMWNASLMTGNAHVDADHRKLTLLVDSLTASGRALRQRGCHDRARHGANHARLLLGLTQLQAHRDSSQAAKAAFELRVAGGRGGIDRCQHFAYIAHRRLAHHQPIAP